MGRCIGCPSARVDAYRACVRSEFPQSDGRASLLTDGNRTFCEIFTLDDEKPERARMGTCPGRVPEDIR
jgi:hypothetical protein